MAVSDSETYATRLDLIRNLAAVPLPGGQVLVTGGLNKGKSGTVAKVSVVLTLEGADGKTFGASVNNVTPFPG